MQTPPISALVKDGNKTQCYKLIAALIVKLNDLYGISWSEFQVYETAKEFYSHYFYWHQLDLKNFFRLCKQMAFEPRLLSVNQFSPLIFAEWAKQYNSEWLSTSEEIQRLKYDSANYDPDRETQIYNREVAQRINARTSDERKSNLQDIVNYQQKIIDDLRK